MTILLRNVSKIYQKGRSLERVISNINVSFEAQKRYVIFAKRRGGKSTMLNLLSSSIPPSKGQIRKGCVVSTPVGQALSPFTGTMGIGRINSLLSTLFAADPKDMAKFLEYFTDQPGLMNMQLGELDSELRMRTAFGFGYGLPADVYLFEHSPLMGKDAMRRRCEAAFEMRTREAGSILFTSNLRGAEQFGEAGGVLRDGSITLYDSLNEAARVFGDSEFSGAVSDNVRRLVREGRTEDAADLLREQVNGDSTGDYFSALLQILYASGKTEELQAYCEDAIEKETHQETSYYYLMRIASDAERHDKVVEVFESFKDTGHSDVRLSTLAAKSFEVLGAFQAAALAYLDAGMDSSDIAIRSALRCFAKAQMWDEMLHILQKTPSAATDAGMLERKVQALFHAGSEDQLAEAIAELSSVSLPRAMQAACNARRRLDGLSLARLLGQTMPVSGDLQIDSTTRTTLVSYLQREARPTGPLAGTAEQQEVLECIARLSAYESQ